MRHVGHCPKKERLTEVEELKEGVKSLENQLGPMLEKRKKAELKKETFLKKHIYDNDFIAPFLIVNYVKAGKTGIPSKYLRLKDRSSTLINPITTEDDGNWRYNVIPTEETWSIFPIHCKIKSIENCLDKYLFLSHPILKVSSKSTESKDDEECDFFMMFQMKKSITYHFPEDIVHF